ncbi:MAG: histidine kinase [Eubacteriales bacterium]|nr:histidine kinase [Eubacteriales bacterium]
MKQTKLQTKLFLAYLCLACLILFSFAVFFYVFVSRQLVDSQIQAMNTLNSSFQNQVDSSLRDLDTVSVNINYSNMSKNILDKSFELNISDNMLTEMADLFIAMSGTELKAAQINLYDFSGNVIQAGLSTMVKKVPIEQLDWMEEARMLEGSKIISSPYETDIYSKSAKYKQWFISLYRSFNNQYGRPVGAIETLKQCKSVFKSVISYKKKNKDAAAQIYIFDKNGSLVYPYEVTEEQATDMEKYFQTVTASSTLPFRSPLDKTNEYAARSVSSYTGYTYLTVQPESAILAPVYNLLKVLAGVVALFLLVSAFISYRLSRSLIRPIKHLKHIIQRMELDTLGQEKATAYHVSVNELEELYQAFQHMSDNLKDSMNQLMEAKEQEVKSRTLALQTQINPHFYYNSLSSIMVLAENGDTDVVVKMCRNLSKIMRYITNTSSTIVTLQEEIDYVQKYLYCMKVRYQTSLNYTISIDDQLLEEKVPKLIIQPIVENAIKYGSDCLPPWYISVKGYVEKDHWQIDVIDSGNGFTEEAIEKISKNIEDALKNPGMPELKINGLGTLNVFLRWKLFCKDDIIFIYGNTADGHGIVSIGRYFSNDGEDKVE